MGDPATTPLGPAANVYTRKNPFHAELIKHELLTSAGSEKETRHFVLSLAGSGLTYTPGDSLGAFGRNPLQLVDEVIGLLGFDPSTALKDSRGQPTTLRETLQRDYILNRANRKLMGGLSELIPQGEQRNRLMELVDNGDVLNEYINSRDYVDILTEFDEAHFETPEVFLSQLSPVVPRLYSIASSHAAHPNEVHICIAIVRYTTHDRAKRGLASGFFADDTKLFVKEIPVYIQESRTFRLPKDNATDIIMCGPGTGIAPFRAFLEQRILEGATGRNWLFFGEQHQASDFLYGNEFLEQQRQGKLNRLDLAFSRDQAEKIYVQNRMLENAAELFSWLESGAHFYVCGDASRMAKDVDAALQQIAESAGGLSKEAAAEYFQKLKSAKRYQRDVY